MSITAISRDTLTQTVSIVRMIAANTIAEVTTEGYVTAQADTLATLNNGTWEWLANDVVLVVASDGTVFCSIDADFDTLTQLPSGSGSFNNLLYGATPVAQVDPGSCTITAAPGAANTATITIQLKDGSGTNISRIIPFRVYASSASTGLTLASAASTGFSVASGGLSLNNGAAITTQISAMSSATGGCVLSLLDTGKQTSYLVLVLANGTKISAQLTSGSYGT